MAHTRSKILVVGPHLDNSGGVANLYKTLRQVPRYEESVDYFVNGNRKNAHLFTPIFDLIRFMGVFYKYKVIHFNPSLEYKSIIRDNTYILLSLMFGKKTIVSLMGWNEKVAARLMRSSLLKRMTIRAFNKSHALTVLSASFKKVFEDFGIKKMPEVITPTYDIKMENMLFEDKNFDKHRIRILYMARIELSKGIYKVLDIFNLLNQADSGIEYSYTVVGDGSELENMKAKARELGLEIEFKSYVSKAIEKEKIYNEHDLFLFPSEHPEGFPLILAEALKGGLVIVASDAGGIGGELDSSNGIILSKESAAPIYVETIIELLQQNNFTEKSRYNKKFAVEKFGPETRVDSYLNLYNRVLDQN
ncbi:MAG: glycosyltransferase family 4 protein [Bacteroidetes bacterium]|nr:glycosyltransferase family 4 protein [Bacteroidota bacterium]